MALVIGNSSYAPGPLKNPVHDVEDIAQMLRALFLCAVLTGMRRAAPLLSLRTRT